MAKQTQSKQLVVNSRRIVWVYLTIVWGWRLKGKDFFQL